MSEVSIRAAKFVDAREMLRLGQEAARASRYAAFASLNDVQAKRAIVESVQRQQGKPGEGATICVVADNGVSLEGLLIGTAFPLYHGLDVLLATDIIWFASKAAHATTGLRLLRAFHKWAERHEGSIVIRHGMTDAIGEPDRVASAFKAAGFRACGHVYEKEIVK